MKVRGSKTGYEQNGEDAWSKGGEDGGAEILGGQLFKVTGRAEAR